MGSLVTSLSDEETILRGPDDLIMSGGRSLLARILKGSKQKAVLENNLDRSRVYGAMRELSMNEITSRIDWMIEEATSTSATSESGQIPTGSTRPRASTTVWGTSRSGSARIAQLLGQRFSSRAITMTCLARRAAQGRSARDSAGPDVSAERRRHRHRRKPRANLHPRHRRLSRAVQLRASVSRSRGWPSVRGCYHPPIA